MSTDVTTAADPVLAARLALQARGLPADDLGDAAALAVAELIGRLVEAGDEMVEIIDELCGMAFDPAVAAVGDWKAAKEVPPGVR